MIAGRRVWPQPQLERAPASPQPQRRPRERNELGERPFEAQLIRADRGKKAKPLASEQ